MSLADIQNFESYAENRKDIEKQQKDTIVAELENLVKNFQSASNKLSTSMSGSLLEMMQTQLTSSMKKYGGILIFMHVERYVFGYYSD